MQRPTGVTILAVLAAIAGVLALLGALAVLAVASSLAIYGITGIAMIVALLFLASAVLELAFAYGAWNLRPWAWTLGIAAEILAIVTNVLYIGNGATNSIVGIVIAGAIIYYLYQPHVRRAFGQNV